MASKKPTFSRTSRSSVWDHFEKCGEKSAVCQLCKKSFAYHGGTSNLLSHLKTSHPSVIAATDGEIAGSASLSNATPKPGALEKFVVSRGNPNKLCSVALSEQLTQLVVEWIATDMRPLNIVNDDGLQRLMAISQPGYNLPSRTHVASIVRRRHADGKEKIKALLESAEFVAVTTDSWTSKAVRSFSTFTVHWLDSNWQFKSFVLATRPLDGRHTADNLAKQFCSIMDEFKLTEKVAAIVHDEAANMVAASRLIKEQLGTSCRSVACAAHMLQTCLRHTLDSSKPVQKLLADGRRLVSFFHHSSHASDNLNAAQLSYAKDNNINMQQPLRVIQDVSTRWNSTYYMLKRLLDLRIHITAVLVDQAKTPKAEHRALLLKDKRWCTAEKVARILDPAEKATALLSGQQYLTASCVLPVMMSLKSMAEAEATQAEVDGDGTVCQMCRRLSDELSSKFKLDPLELHSHLPVAAALDPRSRALPFLDADGRSALKLEVLSRCPVADENDLVTVEPAPKRPTQVLDLFFGTATDQEVCESMALEKEVDTYFSENPAPPSTDPLRWWEVNASRFPHLAKLARGVLCVPATSVPAERVFSAAGHIVSKRRAGLSEENIDALIFLKANGMQCGVKQATASQAPLPLDVVLCEEKSGDADDLPPLPCLE